MLITVDYPLAPNEEKTEILRVVVRETMSLDLLNRLIADICSVTQTLMETDVFDLTALGGLVHNTPSPEQEHQSLGKTAKQRDKHGSKRPMTDGVHRTVC